VEVGCAFSYRRVRPKAKDSSVQLRREKLRRELLEPESVEGDFYGPAQDVNLPYKLIAGLSPVMSKR